LKNGVSISDKIYGNASSGQIDKPDLLWSHLKSLPAFRALLRAVEARFYQHIDLPEPVLDLGCGDGLFAELTFDKPVTAGLDPWWGPLVKAKRTQAYGQVAQGLGHTLPFASETFGSAFSNSVLEHIADLQPVLYEINRVLRDNGRFVVTMPSHHFTADLRGAMALERLRLNRELAVLLFDQSSSCSGNRSSARGPIGSPLCPYWSLDSCPMGEQSKADRTMGSAILRRRTSPPWHHDALHSS